MIDLSDDFKRARAILNACDALLITAGAGMGVDSGLPDFRGTEGFWRAYPQLAKRGLRFEQIATPDLFEKSPSLAWAFYGHRLNLYRSTEPHEGFAQLLGLAQGKPLGYFVFTSNIDGHFQKARFAPERVVECHGSIHHLQCARRCPGPIWDAPPEEIRISEEFRALPPLPSCPRCGATARPNILMFGDSSWISTRTRAQGIAFGEWLGQVKTASGSLAIIELGAGTTIPTVRMISEGIAAEIGAPLIRVNPQEAEGPAATISIAQGALEGLRTIMPDLPN